MDAVDKVITAMACDTGIAGFETERLIGARGVGMAPQISNFKFQNCEQGCVQLGQCDIGGRLDLAGTGERSCIAEISLSEPRGSYHIIV